MCHDVEVALRFAGTGRALPVPLQHPARTNERAAFLGEAGGRQTKHLGLDRAAVDVVERAVVLPELRCFGRERIHAVAHIAAVRGLVARAAARDQRDLAARGHGLGIGAQDDCAACNRESWGLSAMSPSSISGTTVDTSLMSFFIASAPLDAAGIA